MEPFDPINTRKLLTGKTLGSKFFPKDLVIDTNATQAGLEESLEASPAPPRKPALELPAPGLEQVLQDYRHNEKFIYVDGTFHDRVSDTPDSIVEFMGAGYRLINANPFVHSICGMSLKLEFTSLGKD